MSSRADSAAILETRFRRVLRLLPPAYREGHAEEILSALLDTAAPGQRFPRPGAVASLVALAVRLRAGAPGATPRARTFGDVLRCAALAGLLLQALYYVSPASSAAVALETAHVSLFAVSTVPFLLADPVLALAAICCLVTGHLRIGRLLSVASTVCPCVGQMTLGYLPPGDPFATAQRFEPLVMAATTSALCTVAVLLGFHRDAPRTTSPRRWVSVSVTLFALVAASSAVTDYAMIRDDVGGSQLIFWLHTPVVSPLGPALAVWFGISRSRRSPVWPAALMPLALPAVVVLVSAPAFALFTGIPTAFAFNMALPGTSWMLIAAELVVVEAALAVCLWRAVRRNRTGYSGDSGGTLQPS